MDVVITLLLAQIFASTFLQAKVVYVRDANVTITSPSFPNDYPPNSSVEWRVFHSSPANFTLHFTHFSLERSDDCKFDSVEILNSHPHYIGVFLIPMCGKLSAPFRSETFEVSYGFTVRFKSDSSVQSQGFSLNITTSTIPRRQLCAYMHGRQKRRLRSIGLIGDEEYAYPADLNCSWTILGHSNKQIELQFEKLDMEFSGPDCLNDHIEVWDIQEKGGSSVDKRLAKLCGRHNPWKLSTNSSKIQITFFSDGSDNTGQFVIRYSSESPSGFTSSLTKNTYVTPVPQLQWVFPGDIKQGVLLICKFRTHPGYSIQVHMKTLSNQAVSLYDGPDTSFPEVRVSENQSVVSSVGFHLIVSVDGIVHIQDNITFVSRRNIPKQLNSIPLGTSHWYGRLVEDICATQCQWNEAFLKHFPNIDNCAYAGLAVYEGDLMFDNLIGTVCNIYRGYMETFFRNLVTSTNNIHILYYSYERARATHFVSIYYNTKESISSSCRRYTLIRQQHQHYKAYSFTLNATFGDRQHNISIGYTEYVWDCFRVQLVPQLTQTKQINILLKGNFRYRICREGDYQNYLELFSNAVSPNRAFTKRCSQYNISHENTETALGVDIGDWPLENILVELGTLPVGHKDTVTQDILAHLYDGHTDTVTKGIECDPLILNLTNDQRYIYQVFGTEETCLRIVLPENNLTAGYYHVHMIVKFVVTLGNASQIKISEESRHLGTKVLWPPFFTFQRVHYLSMQRVDVVVSFVQMSYVHLHIEAVQFTPRQLRLGSTPTEHRCVLFEGHCYTLTQPDPPTSWLASRAACLRSGGDLVSVNSWEELRFLKEALSSKWFNDFYGKRRGMIFIGLNDTTKASDYHWVDGSPLTVSDWYYPFDPDLILPDSPEPPIDRDHIQPVVNRSQRCVAMVPGNSFSSTNWRKVNCGQSTYPSSVYGICEYNNNLFPLDGNRSRAATHRDENVTRGCKTGWHFAHNKCLIVRKYRYMRNRQEIESLCASYGARLPSINTIRNSESLLLSLGSHRIISFIGTFLVNLESGEVICLEVSWNGQFRSVSYSNCKPPMGDDVICERDPVGIKMYCRPYQFSCDDGTCLNPDRICDLTKDCSHGEDESNCNLPGYLFTCDSGEQISVFKYCDFLVDCLDGSDENLCIHKSCSDFQFQCDNKECVSIDQRCDQKPDCIDDSDEKDCDWEIDCHGFRCPLAGCVVSSHIDDIQPDCPDNSEADESSIISRRVKGCPGKTDHIRCHKDKDKCYPVDRVCVYDHDVYGRLKYCPNGAHLRHCREHECPEMFKCPQSYCIPHHKVCDGVRDCVRAEDESNCGNKTCPGMLKCGSANQCVPQQNVCDMEVNCKYERSDETFCDLHNESCHLNCTCVGYYVDCRNSQLQNVFDISVMGSVRVLDLGENNISFLGDINFAYLTVLYLQHNNVQNLSSLGNATLNNLLYFDLSFNRIKVIPDHAFSGLYRLQTLRMAGNPVHYMAEDCFLNLIFLRTLNLNAMLLEELGPRRFACLDSLRSLDLSNNSMQQLSPESFASLPPLDVLYLHDNLLNLSTPEPLKHLDVTLLKVDSFRFCCAAGQTRRTCEAPVEDSMSCDDLLPTVVIRVAVGVFAILAILGNGFVISWRLYKRLPDVPSVLIFHLGLSDLLMGLYLLTISVADLYYHEVYFLHDLNWRASVYCKLIGVIGFISCEMSMYTLVLIAVDRTKKLAFPLSSGQITVTHAWKIQLVGWGFWTCLGVFPLILPEYFGDYYGRNSICLPFNFADPKGPGWEMTTAIFVGFNSIGLFMIIAMYALIFVKVKESQKRAGRRDRIEVDIARKLSIVIVTDLACMLPIVLANFTSVLGLPTDRDMTSILANLLLPLNSALNPFLFTLNTLKMSTVCTCNRKL